MRTPQKGAMHLPILVLSDPHILRHMVGVGHFIRFRFHDGTTSISGPYTLETARHLASVYGRLRGLAEPPETGPSFEILAEEMESKPGRRWFWLGRKGADKGGARAIRGPFKSRKEAVACINAVIAEARQSVGVWEAEVYYKHEASAYPRTRRKAE